MNPKPANEESEDRASSNMADVGASGGDASSVPPASADGAQPGQLGVVGPSDEPEPEPVHEQAIRNVSNQADTVMWRGWHAPKGKATSPVGATCPNCSAFLPSSAALAYHDCEDYRERRAASEIDDRLGRPLPREHGWISAQWHPLVAVKTPPTHIDGVPVSWLVDFNCGTNHGRQATHRTDVDGSPIVGTQSLSPIDWIRADLLAAEGWNVERLKSDQPAHRPAEKSKDPEELVRFVHDAIGLFDGELAHIAVGPKALALQTFVLSSFEVEMVSSLLSERHGRGYGERTLYRKLDRARASLAVDTSEPDVSEVSKGGGACFKCAGPGGKPRSSVGASAGFYDVGLADAARTIHLCDACYVSPAERSARKKALEKSRAPSPEKRYTRPPEEGSVVHKVVAQNTMILARIERIEAQLAQTLARCAEAADRLRDRFPTDAEVSDAVETFLGVAVAEDESEAA